MTARGQLSLALTLTLLIAVAVTSSNRGLRHASVLPKPAFIATPYFKEFAN